MKWVELRRHTLTGDDKRISAQGLALAQAAASDLPERYDRVLSSPALRCLDTVTALGLSNPEIHEAFGTLPGLALKPHDEKVQELAREKGIGLLEAYLSYEPTKAIVLQKGRRVLEAIEEVAEGLPENGRALVVSHSGTIEPAAMALLGTDSLSQIGGALDPCEGMTFVVEKGRVARFERIRLKKT